VFNLRLQYRFILIGLALLGLSTLMMNAAQASSYKLSFTTNSTYDSRFFQSPGDHFVLPDTHLMDIFFDTIPGGPQIDDPLAFDAPINSFDPLAGKITGIDLYNYGKVQGDQHNPYSAAPPVAYDGFVVDDPRDGFVNAWFIDTLTPITAPDPYFPASDPFAPTLDLLIYADFHLNGLPFAGLGSPASLLVDRQSHWGTWNLSEVSAVPIPAAAWLFGTALIGLVGFSKRRKT
jgi:hypothetical protein